MIKKIKICFVALCSLTLIFSISDIAVAQESSTTFMATLATIGPSDLNQYDVELVKGWNFIAFQARPLAEEPEDLFIDKNSKPIPIDNGNLYSFNPHTQKNFTYDPLDKDAFGPIDQGLGYWIEVGDDVTLKYWGIKTYRKRSTWLHKGMNMIAYPYEKGQLVDNLIVKEHATGKEIKFVDARAEGIINPSLYTWTNDWRQGLIEVGLEEDFFVDNTLEANHGYWIECQKEGYEIVSVDPATL